MYKFSNILGVFVFDEKLNVVDEFLFDNAEDCINREKLIDKASKKHKNLKEPDDETLRKILVYFKKREFFANFYSYNLQLTKFNVKNSVNDGTLIIQAINSVDELDKAVNILVKRLREWYDLHNPEFSRHVQSHELFVEEILEKGKIELLGKLKIREQDSIGADLKQEDLEPIRSLTHQIYGMYQLRKNLLGYISELMDELCPNLKALCDVVIGAKLIEHAGSLKRLSEMPSSTIQILGAEKALFRHLRTGARPPRHGLIVNHPLIATASEKMHGKIARALADKISIASKVDYFQGQFVGDKLRKSLEEKFVDKK